MSLILSGDENNAEMPTPTPIKLAKEHEKEARRLADKLKIEQSYIASIIVGRFVRDLSSRKAYKVTQIKVNSLGTVILKGVLLRGKVPVVIGGLMNIELITEQEACSYRLSEARTDKTPGS